MELALEKKYRSLAAYFSESTNQTITLTFEEIEKIMGYSLPSSAYLNYSWWKKTKSPARHYQAWTAAGYFVKYVQPNHYVVFEKTEAVPENEGHQDVLIIRPALHGDARFLSVLYKKSKMESKFLVYGQEPQEASAKKIRQQIIEWNQSGRSVILLAILNGEHVGYMKIVGTDSKRAAHRAEVDMVVQAHNNDMNILSALIQKSEEWAAEKGLKRFEITILEENAQARKLFEQNAYKVEGIRKSSVSVHGTLQNEVYMGKVFK
ncbi:GNAT family N-acetyltransferase [Planococcus maritimus]|uniref:GNAT family N-acetyltransferase n=1 Tax=Planococcus maritimus TaxID=192421 RepID=UPI000795A2F2|nr:GNAT family N-acetyltransferase [Planococcus maritimus]KYG58678.1 acetyltransferase [Planococcus maritimus]